MRFSTRDFPAERRSAVTTMTLGAVLLAAGAAGVLLMLVGRASPS